MAEEDEALLAAEAQLPGGDDEIHWSELESDSSEDVEYFPPAAPASHDHKAGGSGEPAPPTSAAAIVSESQVTQPSELTSLLQQLVTQQREDRLAQEEARRAHEAQIAAIQREAARGVQRQRSVLSASLTEFHRLQTLSSSRCSRA